MSASGYVAVVMVALLACLAWVIDGDGQLTAHQHAVILAQDAARVGAKAVTGTIVQIGATELDPHAAAQAAQAYLASAGADGSVSVSGDAVTVTVVTEYETRFPAFLGLDVLKATATATARLLSG